MTGPVVAGASPEWFELPLGGVPADAVLTIDACGRVLGRVHTSAPTMERWRAGLVPTRSPTGGAAFHQSGITWNDGTTTRAGLVSAGHLAHTERHDGRRAPAVADPHRWPIVARVCDDEHGAVLCGSIRPGVSAEEVAAFSLCALSAEWGDMLPEWWELHGIATTEPGTIDVTPAAQLGVRLDLAGVALVERPANPLPELAGAKLVP